MSRKSIFVLAVLLIVGFLVIAIPVSSQMGDTVNKDRGNIPGPEPTEVFKELPPIQPSPTSVNDKAVEPPQDVVEESYYLQRIHDVLGIPLEELHKMDWFEIHELAKQNADALGIQVWESRYDPEKGWVEELVAGSRIFDPMNPESRGLIPTPPPPSDGYPAPQSNSATEKSVADVVESGYSPLLQNNKIYLPLLFSSDLYRNKISIAKADAKLYIDKLYQDNAWNGFIKEYPAIPVWIKNMSDPLDYRSKRMLGHYYQTTSHPVGKVVDRVIGADFEVELITFEEFYDWTYGEPNLNVETIWNSGGETHYRITKVSWTGSTTGYENVYFGNQLIMQDVYSLPNGTAVNINAGVEGSRPAHRFTIRHATKLGTYFYEYYTDPYKVQQLNATVNTYGFNTVPDIYAPLFGKGASSSNTYMFTTGAYHDCELVRNGMDSTISFGDNPHRYPYESKACVSIQSYITLSRLDYLVPALQAIHILNKYNNADYVYTHPTGVGTTTPRQMARWLETKWNGYGIPAYLKDSAVASGIRTNAFVSLESILGYKYNDLTSRSFADQGIDILLKTQVGNIPLYNSGWVPTSSTEAVFRPNQNGAQLLAWNKIPSSGSYYFSLAPKTFLSEVVDLFGMPPETLGSLISNAETTFSYWAALNLYEFYKYPW